MDAPNEPCNGYWYNVNVKTPTAGPAWKCISQAEYNTVMAQQAHDDQVGGIVALILIGTVFGGIALALLIGWIVNKRKKSPQQKGNR